MNWNGTQIWERLSKIRNPEAERVKAFLSEQTCMDKISKILDKGATSPKDFTLHDADHSFRVAERMWEIIPPNTKKLLSEYELALLLLSAYLHDIGMTPEYQKVHKHYLILTNTDKNQLAESEKLEFQRWLDEEGEQIDIENEIITDDEKVEEIITFYCRYKHNDWSEEWMTTNFKEKQLGNYNNWLNDLIIICKSHHFGLEELINEKFNPIRIYGRVVHRRYIAMCLRLADVIEIDPERAPEVLMKHRSVIKGSLSHWLKERVTSIDIINNSISITATPSQAFIHKAIDDISLQIENETKLCNTLKGEIPLSNIFPSNDLKHEWNILPTIYKNIKETGNYEYIEGTFRPNTKKILELLGGTELYGDPVLAIRELIQNSFDAVKVQMGYKILEDKLHSKQQIKELKERYLIDLSIIEEGDAVWIVCSDNGVGMDKNIIKKCFLVGGAVKRHEILDLERKCNAVGYNLELTAHFGIGVMSYFMLADKVIIQTRKSMQSNSYETNGWEFEINGLSDFGELRKFQFDGSGSTIKLRVKKELENIVRDVHSVKALLQKSLIRIPCKFRFTFLNNELMNINPGWVQSENFFKTELIKRFGQLTTPDIKTSQDFVSEEIRLSIEVSQKRKTQLDGDFEKSLEMIVYDGKLDNNMGYYRIHIPYFKNLHGNSFAYFFEELEHEDIYLQKINDGHLFIKKESDIVLSWKGIGIDTILLNKYDTMLSKLGFIEIDFNNDKSFEISISRTSLNLKEKVSFIFKEVHYKIRELILNNQKIFIDSNYALFNKIFAPFLKISVEHQYWNFNYDYRSDKIKIEKVMFPLIFDISTDIGDEKKENYLGERFYRLEPLVTCGKEYTREWYSVEKYVYKFDIAVYHDYYNFRISFLIVRSLDNENRSKFIGNSALFPPDWGSLFCFRGYHEHDIVLNENSPYFKYINEADYTFVKSFVAEKEELNSEHGRNILESKSKCINFILHMISLNQKSIWDGVIRNNKQFIKKLWEQAFESDNVVIYFFHDGISNTNVISLSIDNWEIITDTNKMQLHFPIPSEKWRIAKK